MPNRDDIAQQQQLLQTYRLTLARALVQLALVGGYARASFELLNTIDECCDNIQRIKEWLRVSGIGADDQENDQAAQRLRALPGKDGQRVGDTPLGTRVVISRFNDGMGALRELIAQVPQIHDAAIQFRTMFQAACEQTNTLRSYKAIHDQLHEIQFRCFENIEQELQRFPKRDQSVANLEKYARNLEDCILELRTIIADTPLLKPEPQWVDTLARAHVQITQALATENAVLMRQAADQIRRVLRIDPSLINTQLITTVRGMRLALLVDIMAGIHETCLSLDVDGSLIERIAVGLAALREVNDHLTVLIQNHDQWQYIDKLLRLFSDSNADIVSLWHELKVRASHLYETCSEPWALELQTTAAKLDHAVQQNDARTIKQQFLSYRTRSMNQFFYVDKKLKRLCDKLDRIDGPFAFVIGVLE